MITDQVLAVVEKLDRLESEMNLFAMEREDVSHTGILALGTKQHHVQLGKPGTGKSWLAEFLCAAVEGARKFTRRMHPGISPDDIIGPRSIKGFEEEDTRRNIEGFLPTAHIFFADELYRTGPMALDPTLSVVNERVYENGSQGSVVCPLISMFGGTNTLMQSEALLAFHDRICFLLEVEGIVEKKNFRRMIENKINRVSPDLESIGLTLGDLEIFWDGITKVEWGDEAFDIEWDIRESFRKEGMMFSDRKSNWILDIVRGEALLSGKDEVTSEDFTVLKHVLWDTPDQKVQTEKLVLTHSNPALEEINRLIDSAVKAQANCLGIVSGVADDDDGEVIRIRAGGDAQGTIGTVLKTLDQKLKGSSGVTKAEIQRAVSKVENIDEMISYDVLKLRRRSA